MKALIFGLFTIVCISNVVSQLDPSIRKEIDDLIQDEYFTKGRISGISLAVVKDGQVLYTNGYGYREVEDSILADSSTLFHIGSISKSFTASIAVKVLSENFPELGESVLDTPIRKLVPRFLFMLSDRYRSEQTTFRDLLAHRVGEYPQDINLSIGTATNTRELIYRQRYSSEYFPFRANFLYSNGHFATAGEILAEIAGVPYLQLLDELLSEIGMTNSTYVKVDDDSDNMPNRAVGYYWKDGKFNRFNSEYYKIVLPMIAAGGIVSDANDMAKYALFHLNSGRVGDKQVVSQEAMSWLSKNSNPFGIFDYGWKASPDQREYLDLGYGLAFDLASYDGWQVYEHTGYLPPFNSQLAFFPATNISVYVAASATGALHEYVPNHKFVFKSIFDILMGQTRSNNIPKPSFDKIIERFPFSISQAYSTVNSKGLVSSRTMKDSGRVFQAGEIFGHYGNGLKGQLDVVERMNSTGQPQPYLILGKWGSGFLNELSANEYRWEIDSDFLHAYYSGGFNDGPDLTASFDGLNIITMKEFGYAFGEFERDLRVGNLPVQPWSPDSCGPQ